MSTERWIAYGECADGYVIERAFPYTGYPTWVAENNAQHDVEEWLLYICGQHGGATFYSVGYTDCYDPEYDAPEEVM